MARMPGTNWRGEHGSRSMTQHDIVCIHTIVGYAPADAAHFSTHHDGKIDQSRDTSRRSAANLDGNHRVIAIENEDHGPAYGPWSGSDVPPLTDAQVTACAKILAWAHEEHGVPLQLCPNSRPGSRGLAYHRQGCDGNYSNGRVSGGELWTGTGRGKVCPGDRRIAQLPEILRQAKLIAAGENPSRPTEPAPEVPVKNNVELARVELLSGFAHLRKGITYLRAASKGRPVVLAVERTITAAYHTASAAFQRLPKS